MAAQRAFGSAHGRRLVSTAAAQEIECFGRPSSSNTQKVLWMLEETGMPYKLTLASARLGPGSPYLVSKTGGKPYGVVDTESYARLNPHRTVPTIIDPNARSESNSVWESHSIVRYLARSYLPTWYPGGSLDSVRTEMWMDWVLGPGNHAGTSFAEANHNLIDQVARTPDEERDLDKVMTANRIYCDLFGVVQRVLEEQPFMAGDTISIADVPVAVELNRWSLCMHALKRNGVHMDVLESETLEKYYAGMMSREAFRKSVFLPELEHHNLHVADQQERLSRLVDNKKYDE